MVWRCFDLDETTGFESNIFAFGQFQDQFFNEGRNVIVRPHFADPLFGFEDFRRHFDIHVCLDRHLAGKTTAFADFAVIEVGTFGRQNVTTTLKDFHFTLGTGSTTATGRGNKDLIFSQRV